MKKIVLFKGDGIGPEIVDAALLVLEKVSEKFGREFEYQELRIGGDAIDNEGVPLTEDTLEICKKADAIILGAVGGDKWDNIDPEIRPERGLLKLRQEMGLYCNLRPATIYPSLKEASPLKDRIVEGGVDIMVVRELIGGIYFGKRETYVKDGVVTAYDTEEYNEEEIKRIGLRAFEAAMGRKKKVTLVDKANVLDSSKLWRKTITEMAADYPEVELDFLYVDNAAMQLIVNPAQFDVILTNNIFGDILSDEASMITGSIGMLPSASLGTRGVHMYEPIHGSAPSIAGQNIANPIGTILSAAMMLEYSFGMTEEARAIEEAVNTVLEEGYRTADLEGGEKVGTAEVAQLIADKI